MPPPKTRTSQKKKGATAMINAKREINRQRSFHTLNEFEISSVRNTSARGSRSLFWLVTILTLLCPLMVRAQELAATLSGTVTDSSGAVIPHVAITIALNGVNAGD